MKRPVFFVLPGFLNTSSEWEDFRRGLLVAGWDWEGVDFWSPSSKAPLEGGLASVADWVERECEAFKARVGGEFFFVLCGYSFGGRVALEWLRRSAQARASFQAVILISTHPGICWEGSIEIQKRWKERRLEADRRWAQRFLEEPDWAQCLKAWNEQVVFEGSVVWERPESFFSRGQLAAGLTRCSAAESEGWSEAFVNSAEGRSLPPLCWVTGQKDLRFEGLAKRFASCFQGLLLPPIQFLSLPGQGHRLPQEGANVLLPALFEFLTPIFKSI